MCLSHPAFTVQQRLILNNNFAMHRAEEERRASHVVGPAIMAATLTNVLKDPITRDYGACCIYILTKH